MYDKGFACDKNQEEAKRLYRIASDGGYMNARFNLATILQYGPDEESMEEAVRIYKELAKTGDKCAFYNLGFLYSSGTAVKRKKEKAVKYYKIAAEKGHVSAMYNLALLYKFGDGIAVSEVS